ncbi:TPA: MBOAT family protein [Neisseria meningitidis]
MPLLSVEFALFFLAFLPIYWGLAKYPSVQNLLLLAAGMGWLYHIGPVFAAIIVLYSSCVYLLGELLRSDREGTRRFWLGCGIAASLTVLGFFKYFDFFRPLIAQYAGKGGAIDILMPLGLSYYTFQSLAYLVYCFRAPHAARFGWHELLLHLSFFPTVTSGPIIRAAAFKSADGEQAGALAQIRTHRPRSPVRPALAVSLILLGIAKKWWLAGMLAENWVSPVFENPAQFDGWGVLAGVYGYTFQLFLDFSGYSDLVIGMAMLLGFRLPKNFSAPLRAANIRAFWDKWHISLSTWIRDYIYIPLGGSKKGFLRTQFNLMAAMVLSGIWHGYGWNFLIWGALHGTALVLLNTGDRYFGRNALCRLKYLAPLSWFVTFHFVCLSFVVFNTANPDDAGAVFSALFANAGGWNAPQRADMLLLASFASVMLLYPYLQRAFDGAVKGLEKIPMWLWFIPVSAVLLLIIVLAPSGIPGFIYANF